MSNLEHVWVQYSQVFKDVITIVNPDAHENGCHKLHGLAIQHVRDEKHFKQQIKNHIITQEPINIIEIQDQIRLYRFSIFGIRIYILEKQDAKRNHKHDVHYY